MPEPTVLPLRPWLAALLSLAIPGLGELYCGERRAGVAVLVGSILTLWLCGLAPLLSAAHAWRLARALRVRAPAPADDRDGSLVADVLSDLAD